MQIIQTRRQFLASLSAASASILGSRAPLANEPPPEVTTIRLAKPRSICAAPQYLAKELLRAEGFADVRYLEAGWGRGHAQMIARGELDFGLNFAAPLAIGLDAGEPLTIIAGAQSGASSYSRTTPCDGSLI